MTAADFFNSARSYKRELTGTQDGLTTEDVAALNAATVGRWKAQGPQTAGNLGTTASGVSGAKSGLSDPSAFFASVKAQLGALDQGQVDGFNALLGAMAGWPLSFAAYGLATPWLETNKTMQPVAEAYWLKPEARKAYFRRMYDIEGERPAKARELGNTVPGDGIQYAGRGYVQLTGRTNYAKANEALGVPLIGNPDLAMQPDVAAKILRWGMDTGAFTTKKLAHYLPNFGPADRDAFKQARRIINGQDRALEIAEVALKMQRALQEGEWKP